MGEKRVDPRKQFSKWLARYGAVVWGLYVFAILVLIAYRPETAMACVYLTLIMTCNKALDTVSYTKNSTTEKIILGILDKTSMELNMKTGDFSIKKDANDNAEEDYDEEGMDDDEEDVSGEDGEG